MLNFHFIKIVLKGILHLYYLIKLRNWIILMNLKVCRKNSHTPVAE